MPRVIHCRAQDGCSGLDRGSPWREAALVAGVPRQRGSGPDPGWVLGLESSARPGETTQVLSYCTSTSGRRIHGGGRSHGAPAAVISLKVDLRAKITSAKEGGDHGGAHRGWDLPEVQRRGGRR